jgi:hypothetical protein
VPLLPETISITRGNKKKYQQYKVNRNAKFSCDACERRIEDDSRKYLFDRD